ncbi:MAG: tetratricopeptide repeat protein [Burkholderiales bacterium]|nr:tetratricopeptide repeat protein [Burkholderiales bacterium]
MKEQNVEDISFLKDLKPFLWIIITGFVLYLQAFFFDFSYLDDNNLILDNQFFLSKLSNIFQSFSIDVFHIFNHSAFYYRPMLTISFILDHQLGGISPFIYHFTSVLLHILSTCLLFIFFKKLNYRKDLSFLFSMLFLVHPVLTQAVVWIPGRNDSLLAVFLLTTFIFFIKHLKEEKGYNLLWALLFFGLSLFTKESAIFAFPILLFYLLFFYKKENKLPFKKFYFFFGSILLSIIWFLSRSYVLRDSTPATLPNMIKSVYFNFPAVIQFFGKIFLPFNLSVLPIMQDTTFIYGIISIILLGIIFFLTKNKRWNFIIFGFTWFFAFLLPSFIRPNPFLPADFIEHRLYVPIIGIFIILLETDFIKKIDLKKKTYLIISGSLLLLFCVITLVHSRNFVNKIAFWENAAKNSPNYPLSHRNLGAMYYLDKRMDEAEKEFKNALELNPTEEMAHNNLGLVYLSKGMLKEAEEEYIKELEVNPNYDNAYFNLGLLYWQQKKYKEAADNWQKTLAINEGYVDAYNALMIYNYQEKNYKEMELYAFEVYKRGGQIPDEILEILKNIN